MLLQLAGALFLCGFVPVEVEGFSPTLIERGIRDLANLYIKGDIELDDLVSSLAVFREDDLQLARGVLPLVEELRDQETVLVHHPSKNHSRVARSIEDRIGGGEFLYKHLSVAKIEFKYPAYGIEERMTSRWATDLSKTVISRATVDPIRGYNIYLIGPHLFLVDHRITPGSNIHDFGHTTGVPLYLNYEFANIDEENLSAAAPLSDKIIDCQIMRSVHKANTILVTQTILEEASEVAGAIVYEKVQFLFWEVELELKNAYTGRREVKGFSFQDSLISPVESKDSISRTSMLETADGVLIASFQRNVVDKNVDNFHLQLVSTNEDSGNLGSLHIHSAHVSNIKAEPTDLQLVQMAESEQILLVVARSTTTLVYEIYKQGTKYVMEHIQTIDLATQSHIVLSSDSLGTFLTLYSDSGKLNIHMWDGESFVSTQEFNLPLKNLPCPYTMMEVTTQLGGDKPDQQLVVVFNDDDILFYHHAMPGALHALPTPAGVQDLIKLGAKIVDVGRRNDKWDNLDNSLNQFVHYIMFSYVENGKTLLNFVDLVVETKTQEIGQVNDVTVCLSDFEAKLEADQVAAEKIELDITGRVPLYEPQTRTKPVSIGKLTVGDNANVNTLDITVTSDSPITLDEFDSTSASSDYSIVSSKLNSKVESSYILYGLYLKEENVCPKAAFKIKAPRVTMDKAKIDTLAVDNIGTLAMTDLLENTLRTDSVQTISAKTTFQDSLTVDKATLTATASALDVSLSPKDFVDLSVENTFDKEFKFIDVAFLTTGPTVTGQLNSVNLADVITKAEMTASAKTGGADIEVDGTKRFSAISTKNFASDTVNGENFVAWKNSLLYKKKELQEISVKGFTFKDINCESASLTKVSGLDMTADALNNIVRKDQDSTVTGNVVFEKEVEVADLQTANLQAHDPADYWITGQEQTITVDLTATNIQANKLDSSDINGLDFTNDIARTDIANTFTAENIFTSPLLLESSLDMEEGVTLAGMDPSSVGALKQVYNSPITVTGKLVLKDTDVVLTGVEIDGTLVDTFSEDGIAGVEGDFFTRNTAQTLPEVTKVETDTLSIVNMELKSTLDGLDISQDLLYTTKDQTINAESITFSDTTYFEKPIHIGELDNGVFRQRDNAKIAGVNFKTLNSENYKPSVNPITDDAVDESVLDYCGRSPERKAISGSLTLTSQSGDNIPKISSRFDVQVLNDFVITTKDGDKSFGVFDDTVAQLKSGKNNEFAELISFSKNVKAGGVTANKHITSDSNAPTLNAKNLDTFNSQIVKKNADEAYDIKTVLTFTDFAGNARISSGGTVDGRDLVADLDKHVLLDDGEDILNSLVVNGDVTYNKDLVITPAQGSTDYFCKYNLVDYIDNHFITGNVIEGKKTLEGVLTVNGDIKVNAVASNNNHPMLVDLKKLEAEALSKTKDQTLAGAVTMRDIQAEQLFTDEVNGIELTNICLRDQQCDISRTGSGNTLKITTDVVFDKDLKFEGTINGKTDSARTTSLTLASGISSITNLDVKGDLDWDIDLVTSAPKMSDLFANLLVKSNLDWSANADYASGQTVSGKTTLNGAVEMADFNINSFKINEGNSKEFDIPTILDDSAKLSQANTFLSKNSFNNGLKVQSSMTIEKLANTEVINGVHLDEYMGIILKKNEAASQEVAESWTFTNGLTATGNAYVKGNIDGVKATDFVLKNVVDYRSIPALTVDTLTVTGDLVGDSAFKTARDTFWDTVEYIDEDSTMTQQFVFNEGASFANLRVTKLNNIPTNTFVTTGTNTAQAIDGEVKLTQDTTTIKGDLTATKVNGGWSFGEQDADTLRIDRAETIDTAAKVVFKEDVKLQIENVYIPDGTPADAKISGLATLVADFIANLKGFTTDLLEYYTANIIDPIGSIAEELYVASRVGFKKIEYLEEITVPGDLLLDNENLLKIDSVNHEGGYMLSVEKGSSVDCSLGNNCLCNTTSVINGKDYTKYNNYQMKSTFTTYRLPNAVFSLTSTYQGYSDKCPQSSAGVLEITGSTRDNVAAKLSLSSLSAVQLGEVMTKATLSNLKEIKETRMFELGSTTFLVVNLGEQGHVAGQAYVRVYKFDGNSWEESTFSGPTEALLKKPAKQITVNTLRETLQNGDIVEKAHLFFIEDKNEELTNEVNVIGWESLRNTITFKGEIQTIAAPGITALDSMQVQITETTEPEVLVTIAIRIEKDFVTTSYLSMLEYVGSEGKYLDAFTTEALMEVGDKPINKILSKKMSDYTNVLIATEDYLSIYDYLPNEGLKLNRRWKPSGGVIVDLAVLEDNLPRSMSKDQISNLIIVISEYIGVRTTTLLRVSIEGKIDLPEMIFHQAGLEF